MVAFNQSVKYIDIIEVFGDGALNHSIDAVAASDNGDGSVMLTLDADHGLLAGSVVYIEGTTNYDGLRMIKAVPETDEISIIAPFVAETPGGTETVKVAIKSKRDYVFCGFRLHLGAAPTTSENLVITADSALDDNFDLKLYDYDLAGTTDLIYAVDTNENLPRKKDDLIRFAWSNTDGKDFGLEIFYAPLN